MTAADQPTAGVALREITDAWAERFCEAVNWNPDGSEWKTVEGRPHETTFRDLAKGYIRAALASQPKAAAPVVPAGAEGEVFDALKAAVRSYMETEDAHMAGLLLQARNTLAARARQGGPDHG